jgi:hypothetical protein
MGKLVPIKGDYLRLLEADKVFQGRFAADAILDDLERQQSNPAEEMHELITVLGGKYQIEGNETFFFNPPTPGTIALLSFCKSPFIDGETLTVLDVDAAIYLLTNGKEAFGGDPALLYRNAAGFCETNELDIAKTADAIQQALRLAMRAFRMFPYSPGEKKEVHYDADWLTSLVAMVAPITNMAPDDIIWRMPMTTVGYYVCQYCRQKGQQYIEKRADKEIVEQIFARTFEMCKERLNELNFTNYIDEEAK